MTITPEDKLKCARRELAMRHRVYPGRVASGRMTREEAAHEIAVMEAICDDYAKLAAAPDLFEKPQHLVQGGYQPRGGGPRPDPPTTGSGVKKP